MTSIPLQQIPTPRLNNIPIVVGPDLLLIYIDRPHILLRARPHAPELCTRIDLCPQRPCRANLADAVREHLLGYGVGLRAPLLVYYPLWTRHPHTRGEINEPPLPYIIRLSRAPPLITPETSPPSSVTHTRPSSPLSTHPYPPYPLVSVSPLAWNPVTPQPLPPHTTWVPCHPYSGFGYSSPTARVPSPHLSSPLSNPTSPILPYTLLPDWVHSSSLAPST